MENLRTSKAAKNPYRGGSRPAETNCGKGRCPANSKLIKALHYERNKEAYKTRALARPADVVRKHKQAWKGRNKGYTAANVAARKWFVRNATPKWLTKEQRAQIRSFYREAERLKTETGIDYQVDHIVPLRGGVVSGLHVPWNLRVITAKENQSKNRKLIENIAAE